MLTPDSRLPYYCAAARPEALPVGVGGGAQAVPVQLEVGGEREHLCVEARACGAAHRVEVVAVCLVLREADDAAVAQLAEQRHVRLADRAAQLARAPQPLRLFQKVGGRLVCFEPLAQHDPRLPLDLARPTPRPE